MASTSDPIHLTAGGVSWQIQPAWLEGAAGTESLFGPDGLRLAEWLAGGQAHAVKQGPHRTVYRVVLPGLDFHVKHYPVIDRRARLRQLVRPSKARHEYEQTRAVAERGVPTLLPIGFGETVPGACVPASYLVTRTLPNTQPLHTYLETDFHDLDPVCRARFRQRLAVALGGLLARMHHGGITHRDLHPGNVLLEQHADGLNLYLIDLHAVDLGPPLNWAEARPNLVILNRWFVLRGERSDRLRFWHAYEEIRECLRRTEPALPCPEAAIQVRRERIRELERATLRSNLHFWQRLDCRCVGSNRYFRRLRSAGVVGHAVADLEPEVLAPLLADPDAPFRQANAVVLKHSDSSSVVELELPGAQGPRRLIYKRFAVTAWSDPWTALVRPTPALRSYVLGHGLRLRCLPTPRPLAVWHRQRHGLRYEGYLLTEKVGGARELFDHVVELAALPAEQRRRRLRTLLDQVARLVATLHERCLSHRDLKAANLLVSPERCFVSSRGAVARARVSGEDVQVWLIDLVGVRRHRRLGRTRKVRDLARLHASFRAYAGLTRTDKLRFLRAYLRWGLRGRLDWKRWWKAIARWTEAKVRRNQRSGRPLG
jgi:tRNA A-37 threonylcarbamoyl transferase component Bud32